MIDWELRIKAAQGCIDKFVGQPYQPGKNDCLRLLAHNLRILGDKRLVLSKLRTYTTEEGAVRTLKATGFESLPAALNGYGFVPIPPASAIPADILALPAEEGNPFGAALVIYVGNNRAVGFMEGEGVILQPSEYVGGWRAG